MPNIQLQQKIQQARQAGMPESLINQYFIQDVTPVKKGNFVTDLLPVAGGIAGATLGSFVAPVAGTIAGGGVGSSAGEWLRQKLVGEEQDTGKILGEGAWGLAGGAAGKMLGAGVRIGGKLLGKGAQIGVNKAAQSIMKATPTLFQEAADLGIDLNKAFIKYAPRLGNSIDDMLGAISKTGRGGGSINLLIREAEKNIDDVARFAGKNVRISGDDVLAALKTQRAILSQKIGEKSSVKALDAVIKEVQKKYAKGLTIRQARDLLKMANSQFGKASMLTGKEAVKTSAQKLEANVIRNKLRTLFPQVAEALDDEQELIMMREAIKRARGLANVGGFKWGRLDITRPGTLADATLNNPAVAKKIIDVGTRTGGPAVSGTLKGNIGRRTLEQTVPRMLKEEEFPESPPNLDLETQTAQAEPILSPGGQWQWDDAVGDWVPYQQAGTAGGGMPTKEQIQKAMIEDLRTNNGRNIPELKTIYEMIYTGEGGGNLTAQQQKDQTNAMSGLRALNRLETRMQSDPAIWVKARLPGSIGARGFMAQAREVADVYTRLRTGAALNDQEIAFYDSQLPGLLDLTSSTAVQEKLQIFRELFESFATGQRPAKSEVPTTPEELY